MSSLEYTKGSDQEENEPMDYEVEYQKQKEEIILLKQSLEREQKLNAELKAHNSPLLLTGMYLDVTLLVEGKKMAVHQNVLSAHSPVLADALLKRGQNEDGVLVITGTKADTFEMLLRFLYTGQVPLLKRQAATELMAAAKEYQADGLKKCLIGQLVSCLPDLVLKALFRQMTLQDQIGARKVCRRWTYLVPEATIKRRELILLLGGHSIKRFEDRIDWALFYHRQTLKLLLKADGTAMYPTRCLTNWNSLHQDSLEQTSANEIASTFIGAKKLQVTVYSVSQSTLDNLGHLLELWSHQLLDLQFFESTEHLPITSTRLFAAINAQSALKKLHLYLNNLPVPDLSIVSQLEELRFNSYCTTAEQSVQWLQQYGEGNQGLARIEYDIDCSSVLELFTTLSDHLRHCFTRLDYYHVEDLATLCAHFRGLTSLFLNPLSITPRYLFTHLATLRQLIHLSLIINKNTFSDDHDLEHHHHLLPQVRSIKALDLSIQSRMPAHQELAKMKLSWTMSNVEVIYFGFFNHEFYTFKCTECHIDNFEQPSEQAKSCLRKLFAPLKRDCAKLRLIKHNKEQVHGTAEELLAK